MKKLFVDNYGLTVIGIGSIFIGIFAFCVITGVSIGWKSACVSADIYNRQNNTSWTCDDFFWAGTQINSSSQTIKIK